MSNIDKGDFVKVIANIKNEIRTTQVKTMQQVNSNLIMMYFRIGKVLSENSRYGNSFIENISLELRLEFPSVQGLSSRNLRSMKLFYEEYKEDEIWQQVAAKLPWWHNMLLIQKIKDKNVRMIYAKAAIENGWSRSTLERQIKYEYHKRIGTSANNFEKVLPSTKSELVNDTFKDPYIFDFLTLREGYKEKELEARMVERIRDVLLGVSSFETNGLLPENILDQLPSEEELNLHIDIKE